MVDSAAANPVCDHCGEAANTLQACSECPKSLEVDAAIKPPAYCSPGCRDLAWPTHRNTCLTRKQLRRAGDLVKTVWLAWREEVFDSYVRAIRREGEDGYLHIYEAFGEFGFPRDAQLGEQDRERVLAHAACFDAFFTSHPLVGRALEGTYTELVEQQVRIPASEREVVRHWADGTIDHKDPWHEILIIDAKDGARYVLDIAGAQYGQFRTVLPWREYNQQAREVVRSSAFGTRVQDGPDVLLSKGMQTARECFGATVGLWERRQGGSLARVLRDCGESEYEVLRDQLAREVIGALQAMRPR